MSLVRLGVRGVGLVLVPGALLTLAVFGDTISNTLTHTPLPGLGYQTVRVQYLEGANNYSTVHRDCIKVVAP